MKSLANDVQTAAPNRMVLNDQAALVANRQQDINLRLMSMLDRIRPGGPRAATGASEPGYETLTDAVERQHRAQADTHDILTELETYV